MAISKKQRSEEGTSKIISRNSLPRKFLVKIGFKGVASKLFNLGLDDSTNIVLRLLEPNPDACILDVGCGGGDNTLRFADRIGTKTIYGIDIIDECVIEAQNRGIVVYKADLNLKWPVAEEKIDVVVSNQNVEHMWNTRIYVSEIFRVLKPGGYAVIATENLASWPNILALILGYQPFSTTNICGYSLGNPLIWHLDEPKDREFLEEYKDVGGAVGHVRVLSSRGLTDLCLVSGFQTENIKGAGYLPFSGTLSKLFSALNLSHAHFIVIKVRKPTLGR